MKIYKDCDTLSIFSFYKIIETNDFTYLLKKRKEGIKLNKVEQAICNQAFQKILKEFEANNATNESLKDYKEQIRIGYMQSIYDITTEILKMYESFGDTRILELLKPCKWKFDKDKEIEPQIKVVLLKMKGLKNKINISNINYKERYRKEKNSNSLNFDLEKEAVRLSISLKLNYLINTKTTSVATWINLKKINEEQIKILTNG